MVFKDSAREFVLLELSNALLSSLHSSSFSSLTSSSLSSRERRASSLDFVAHTGARNRTALESLFFLFVVSLCVLKTRKCTRTRTTTETKRRSICVADEEDGKEESAVTPTTRENNGEEGGEGDENTSSFCGEVLSSDDDEDDNEEEEELDEELEDVHRKWEIVARYPCVLHRVERSRDCLGTLRLALRHVCHKLTWANPKAAKNASSTWMTTLQESKPTYEANSAYHQLNNSVINGKN